ncbi:MAG TPA: ABC transporter substrate-binding protein [Thermodesulfobacteriaceae bacterium]|nr:ABC transporter substrate-binding protein [Thermodesulfobacteriaceae bacterium]
MKRLSIIHLFSAFLFLTAFFLSLPETQARAAGSPRELIQETVDAVMDVLKDREICHDDRRARISTLIVRRFDFGEMSRRVLGVNWKKATPEQKTEFTKIFARLIEASYIGKIDNYTDEKVIFEKELIKRNYARVFTTIRTGTKDIPVTYSLIFKKGTWWVYDVKVENVSLVSTYRSNYNQIIRNNGFDHLLQDMKAKLAELEAGNGQRQGKG